MQSVQSSCCALRVVEYFCLHVNQPQRTTSRCHAAQQQRSFIGSTIRQTRGKIYRYDILSATIIDNERSIYCFDDNTRWVYRYIIFSATIDEEGENLSMHIIGNNSKKSFVVKHAYLQYFRFFSNTWYQYSDGVYCLLANSSTVGLYFRAAWKYCYKNKNTLQLWDRRFCRWTHLCKLCVILRSRVLRVVCPHEGYRSAAPLATTV